MILDGLIDKFEEHIEYLTQTNDVIASIPDKIKSLFEGGSGILGRFIK